MTAHAAERSASGEPLLVVKDLHKAFGGHKVVNGVSFSVAEGEMLALIGPNGAGKTTLLNLLSGQHKPTAGRILFAGMDITGKGAATSKAMLRAFQDGGVFPKLTTLENVMVPLLARGVAVREARDRAMAALCSVGLEPVAHERGERLSGGQRKLTDFSRCIAAAPRLVLLDEPTAGVHPHVAETMVGHITRQQAADVGFVIISHDLPWVFAVCPRVICLAAGEILCEGTPERVGGDPRVHEAYL